MHRRGLTQLVLSLFVLPLSFSPTLRAEEKDTPTVSPDDAVKMLKAGNERYVAGKLEHPNVSADRRGETAKGGQKPYVTILSCADSRVPLEFLFDAGIGDLFVIRVAGNVADTDEIGTIEYGVGHLKTPVLLVLGHTKCGAVTAVVQGADVHGCIPELVDNIKPAVDTARKQSPKATTDELVNEAIRANVWQSIEDTVKRSAEVRELINEKKLRVIGGIYDIESGRINWLGQHPNEAKLAAATDTGAEQKTETKPEQKTESGKPTEHGRADAAEAPTTPRLAEHVEKAPSTGTKTTTDRPTGSVNAAEVLAFLKAGNERYTNGTTTLPRAEADRRTQTAKDGQKPLVTVVSCSDSRVPVETIFNQGVGDVFVVRVAGNICDTEQVGSVEYGVEHLGTPLVVVLGHTKCGAVTAAATHAEVHGNIAALIEKITPAVMVAKERHPELEGDKLAAAAIEANVWQSMDDAFKASPILREMVSEKKAMVVGAIYDIETGKVRWLGEHPELTKLLGYAGGPKTAKSTSESKKR